ncbi:MAG TPA: hypothetical protein VN661_09700 [Candidatus Acidoferrales bacterium]|nr:hypothetical protein [Candidatus Acidoferrales bacterium]
MNNTALVAQQNPAPDLYSRHQRKCSVCCHPDREEIEQEFVSWRDTWSLARQYEIQDYRSLYRHAAATGLLERRRANMRVALDAIIEQTPTNVTADAVIRAIRAQCCLTDHNTWVEPANNIVVTAIPASARRAQHSDAAAPAAAPKLPPEPALLAAAPADRTLHDTVPEEVQPISNLRYGD